MTNSKLITENDFLFPPQGILAFTLDPATIKSHYPNSNQNALVKMNAMPPFPDDEASVSLVNGQGVVIDNFMYSKSYHSVFISDKEGVSLERIHANESTNDQNNWKSAASTVGSY